MRGPGGSNAATAATAAGGFVLPELSPSRFHSEFEELGPLGQGGFGSVFRARNRLDRREYAVKKIALRRARWDTRVLREVTTLARFDHPHIVRYHGAWMEYAPGRVPKRPCGPTCWVHHHRHWAQASAAARPGPGFDSRTESLDEDEAESGRSAAREEEDGGGEGEDGEGEDDESVSWSASAPGGEMSASGARIAVRTACACPAPLQPMLLVQMELCQSTLAAWLEARNSGTLAANPPFFSNNHSSIMAIFRQILAGVRYLHANNVIHRDIKPSNLFLTARASAHAAASADGLLLPTVKLGDFGLARELLTEAEERPRKAGAEDEEVEEATCDQAEPPTPFEKVGVGADGLLRVAPRPAAGSAAGSAAASSGPRHTANIGTSSYAAPEQLRGGGSYNNKADIYSLGIVFLEMLCPFATASERARCIIELRDKHILPPHMPVTYPKDSAVVLWMTNAEPSTRPSADQLLDTVPLFDDGDGLRRPSQGNGPDAHASGATTPEAPPAASKASDLQLHRRLAAQEKHIARLEALLHQHNIAVPPRPDCQ